eukprot:g30751.t1
MLELYRALVKLQLVYRLWFELPHYRKDVIAVDSVQRRFTRMWPGMEKLSSKDRLDRLGLCSLQQRRLRDAWLRGMGRVIREQWLPLVEGSVMRGHSFRINNPDMRVQILKDFVKQHFPATPLLDYALEVEKITTSK